MKEGLFDGLHPGEVIAESENVLVFVSEALTWPRDEAGQLSGCALSGSALRGLVTILEATTSRLEKAYEAVEKAEDRYLKERGKRPDTDFMAFAETAEGRDCDIGNSRENTV